MPDDPILNDAEINRLLSQTQELRDESAGLRASIREFAEILRRGFVRATVQGVVLTLAAVVLAVSLLGYLTSKSWTCDPLELESGSVRYWLCDKAFPQTTQQAKFFKANQEANAATAKLVTSAAESTAILQEIKTVLVEVQTRLNPAPGGPVSPTQRNICVLVKKLAPEMVDPHTCP